LQLKASSRQNSSQDPISKKKNPSPKRAGEVAQSIGPEFKPQYRGKKKKEEERKRKSQASSSYITSMTHSGKFFVCMMSSY
jgi:hypothetical protein